MLVLTRYEVAETMKYCVRVKKRWEIARCPRRAWQGNHEDNVGVASDIPIGILRKGRMAKKNEDAEESKEESPIQHFGKSCQ
jgi:hypothetical protein